MYWVYENWTAEKKAVIHRSDCSHCRNGHGAHPNKLGNQNGRWHGSYDSYDGARTAALRLHDREVRDCRHCRPS